MIFLIWWLFFMLAVFSITFLFIRPCVRVIAGVFRHHDLEAVRERIMEEHFYKGKAGVTRWRKRPEPLKPHQRPFNDALPF